MKLNKTWKNLWESSFSTGIQNSGGIEVSASIPMMRSSPKLFRERGRERERIFSFSPKLFSERDERDERDERELLNLQCAWEKEALNAAAGVN